MAMVLNPLILLSLLTFVSIAMETPPMAKPNCVDKCGNVKIPYPFGIGEGCYRDPDYNIKCDPGTHMPYIRGEAKREVINITLSPPQQAVVKHKYFASQCYNSIQKVTNFHPYWFDLNQSPFRFAESNKFMAIGCNTMAYIGDEGFTSGCLSRCKSMDILVNGSCSGNGCCQSSIPNKGLKFFNVSFASMLYDSEWASDRCKFAVVAHPDSFTFDTSYASMLNDKAFQITSRTQLEMVLDWAIGNQTCKEALDDISYACGPNSHCKDSTNGPGYNCYCQEGFEGNPYLPQVGCQDVDECKGSHNCSENAKCNNYLGGYNCYCPKHFNGDGWNNGTKCKQTIVNRLAPGIGAAGSIFLPVFIWLWFWAIQERQRKKNFEENGGILLKQQIANLQKVKLEKETKKEDKSLPEKGDKEIFKFFTLRVIKNATQSFKNPLREGEFDKVYDGGKVPATIRKPEKMNKGQIIQFINEVYFLSQTNHDHLVKLLGCCLEDSKPMLVYEFFSNRTLFDYIHGEEDREECLSWKDRLRIATELANALDYLHSFHSVPIFHGNVKSSTILIDCHITDKSDVYSFGVVLMELVTGKKPSGIDIKETLENFIASPMQDENFLDARIKKDGRKEDFKKVAEFAIKCVQDKGEDRPTMKTVVMQLDSFKVLFEASTSSSTNIAPE
ncbi:wall-associated receptor kinase 2-like isoform X2 [Macadamia integrifolia]|uniref:wall-associated receptor kinase 2-like isoform X2 n=1 Tax=Macadamia integrifolia TaxID=60698 RepID=UPI001C4F5C4C|nr:wall-associated receptor kinase 2-like isoform X2 [Macadamia integrifolia]